MDGLSRRVIIDRAVVCLGLMILLVGCSSSLMEAVALSPGPDALGEGDHRLAQAQAMVVVATDNSEARSWLEANRLEHGWGLPFLWDAFSDGTVNPVDTSYAVTTGWGLQALPDRELAHWWLDHAWEDGCYWYSDQPQDSTCVPNVSALMLGASAPLLDDPRLAATVDRLAELALPGPVWPYQEDDERTNDLMHHAYIVWGLESYRDSGGEVPWTREELLSSMNGVATVDRWHVAGLAMRAAVLGRWGKGGEVPGDRVTDPRTAAHVLLAETMAP